MLRSAIIGCGGIAGVHKRVLEELPSAKLVACCDIKKDRAVKLAVTCGISAYDSVEKMLEMEKPEVVHLCLPHYLHVPYVKMLTERGIHVFTEKPPVINEAQWNELYALRGGDARVGICFQNRYNHPVMEAKRLLESGSLGAVKGARGFVTWCREASYYTESDWKGRWETEGGGVLINQSIHTLDLLTWLLGPVNRVESNMCNHSLKEVIEVEDTLEAFIEFKSGARAIFFASNGYCSNSPVFLEICCEKATLAIESSTLIITWKDGTVERCEDDKQFPLGKDYWGNSHYACIEDFYSSILENRRYMNDIESVRETTELMLKIYAPFRGTNLGAGRKELQAGKEE